jgi:hypothetical protein
MGAKMNRYLADVLAIGTPDHHGDGYLERRVLACVLGYRRQVNQIQHNVAYGLPFFGWVRVGSHKLQGSFMLNVDMVASSVAYDGVKAASL